MSQPLHVHFKTRLPPTPPTHSPFSRPWIHWSFSLVLQHAQSCYEEEEEAAAGGVSSGLCGCLIPGHSKRVAITDPRVQKQNRANRAKEKNKHPY